MVKSISLYVSQQDLLDSFWELIVIGGTITFFSMVSTIFVLSLEVCYNVVAEVLESNNRSDLAVTSSKSIILKNIILLLCNSAMFSIL